MTATLAGMLVEEGKLSWNTTIGEALGGPTQGVNPALATVSLEQLLSHRMAFQRTRHRFLDIYFNSDALKQNIASMRLPPSLTGRTGRPPANPAPNSITPI